MHRAAPAAVRQVPAASRVPAAAAPPRRRGLRVPPAVGFLGPSLFVLAVFVGWPIAQSLWMSLHEWSFLSPDRAFVGLGNYRQLLDDDRFWNALRNTGVYTVVAVSLQIVLAVALAVGLQTKRPGTALLRAAYFFPVISSVAIMGIVWKFLLNQDIGLISAWLTRLGIPSTDWLASPTWAMPAVILVGTWKNVGFNMVILLAGLQGIPQLYYEAAAVDGAGRWAAFRHVTLPGLRPALLFATVISVIASLQLFDQVYVMTGGGPLFGTETLVTYLYNRGFVLFDMGYASAIAWVLFGFIMIVSVLQLRLFRYRDVDA